MGSSTFDGLNMLSSLDDEGSSEDGNDFEMNSIKSKIRRSWRPLDGKGPARFVSQVEYERLSRDVPKQASQGHPAVSFQDHTSVSSITMHSQWLVEAYKKVYNLPVLSRRNFDASTIEEMSPYPGLYLYIDDIGREIALLNNNEAVRDYKALEFVLKEATQQIWPVGRITVNSRSDAVSYDQLWHMFIPGHLVVCHDELENRNLLMLAKVKVKSGYMSLYAWQLGWDHLHHCFERKMIKFHIATFHVWKKMTSLVIYPLTALPEDERDELLSELRTRGRKWAQVVTGPALCCFYQGLSSFAYTEDPLALDNDDDSLEVIQTISLVSISLPCTRFYTTANVTLGLRKSHHRQISVWSRYFCSTSTQSSCLNTGRFGRQKRI